LLDIFPIDGGTVGAWAAELDAALFDPTAGPTTPAQCVKARRLLGWSLTELARAAAIGFSTVADFEKERRTISDRALDALSQTLKAAGVEFTIGDAPGVRLKLGPIAISEDRPLYAGPRRLT
jgi:Helix-turn-helix